MKTAGAWRGGCGSEGGGADSVSRDKGVVGTGEYGISHSVTPLHTHSPPSLQVPGPRDVRNSAPQETTEHVLSAGCCSFKSTISYNPPNSPIFHLRELRLKDKTIANCQSQTGLSDTLALAVPRYPRPPTDLLSSCLQETFPGSSEEGGGLAPAWTPPGICPYPLRAVCPPLMVSS